MFPTWRSTYINRSRRIYFLIFCGLFIIIYLVLNHRLNFKKHKFNELTNGVNVESTINRIRDIPILDQKIDFNITQQITVNNIPEWIYRYKITHLFDFNWLLTGGYKWHLQQMIHLKTFSTNKRRNFDLKNIFNSLSHHPENGVIIDTAPDPFQLLFPPLPYTSSSLHEVCIRLQISKTWYPCFTRSEMIPSFSFEPLITYALYDVTIGISAAKSIHYDEVIYLFDDKLEISNETFFVTQTLPRLIRLLALVPETALILLPYRNRYIDQYINILIARGLLKDKKRLIRFNSENAYHAHVVYSTSSPRSDLVLLHRILIGNRPPLRRELILIIRNNFDNNSYNKIVQTINQFELPETIEYLHIQEYHEITFSMQQINYLFAQAMIVIGLSGHILSHIVWCLPGTHIIEIGDKTMTTDYYEISLQLKLNYWLAVTSKTNQIDMIDFRNLIMKLLSYIDT